jgi:short-subunit dehydrogenase
VDTDMAKGDGKFWVATTEKAGKQIVKAINAKREIVYVSKRWKLIAILFKILPNSIYKRI